MSKSRVGFGLVLGLFCLAAFMTVAEALFSSPATNAPAASGSAATAAPALSPSDFKNHVADLNKQTQNTLKQQFQQSLSKNPAPPLPPAPSATANKPAAPSQSSAPSSAAPLPGNFGDAPAASGSSGSKSDDSLGIKY
jgi:hypothetical protein